MTEFPDRTYWKSDNAEYISAHATEFKKCNDCDAIQRLDNEECMYCGNNGFDPLDQNDLNRIDDMMMKLGNYVTYTYIELPEEEWDVLQS